MVKFNNEEVKELRKIVQEWLSEGFVSELNNVQKEIVDKLENEENNSSDEYYKEEGVAIYSKGRLVYGIHPDNVDNNLKHLKDGTLKFDWGSLEKIYNIY